MLGFLSAIGSGLGKLGSALGRGAAGVGRGIGRGVKRLGELGDDEMSPMTPMTPNPMLTPDFNPAAGRGIRSVEDAVAGAENAARGGGARDLMFRYGRDDVGMTPGADDPPDLPIQRANMPIPALSPAPAMADMRSPLPITPPARPLPSMPAAAPPTMNLPAKVGDDSVLDRANVPIPQLPGRSGAPVPYNPIDAAKYDAVMKRANRDDEGNYTGGFKRDWKTVLQNALLGASRAASGAQPGENVLGRAAGGALAAGAGSAINPQAGYEFNFDVGQRPKIEDRMARERAERDRAMEDIFTQAKVDSIPREVERERADLDRVRAQTDATRAGMKDADLTRRKGEAEIGLIEARRKAIETGKPVYKDIAGPGGQVMTVGVFPDGSMTPVGESGAAAMQGQRIESQQKIAAGRNESAERRTGMQQSNANARSAASRAGAKERTQMRIDAKPGGTKTGSKTVTADQLQRYADSRKMSKDEAKKKLAGLGYNVP